ncbi:MAG: PP2C family protein-serine/threonine phosphatase [bacterium]
MRILIVEDDLDSRLLLKHTLENWGHDIIASEDGAEAWQILYREPISFVITDWMMPEMDGLELCRRIRAADFKHYVYIILLTAKNDKKELVAGMEAGADDFVVKPFNKGELNVRIRAGERILKLEKDLDERNQKLSEAYSDIKKDLEAAAKVQESLLPDSTSMIHGVKFEWLFMPCTFVAGDIFSFFPVDEKVLGFYHLDVAGHGVPAAMLSVTLSKMLSQTSLKESFVKKPLPVAPFYKILTPPEVVYDLNERFQNEDDNNMQYFTMVYGLIDVINKKLRFTQAGHPTPMLLKQNEEIQLIGNGGVPVGMLPGMEYEECEYDFQNGDRLFIYSDGITECTNREQEQFSENRLIYHIDKYRDLPLRESLNKLKDSLRLWRGSDEYEDDVSILALEGVEL